MIRAPFKKVHERGHGDLLTGSARSVSLPLGKAPSLPQTSSVSLGRYTHTGHLKTC